MFTQDRYIQFIKNHIATKVELGDYLQLSFIYYIYFY